MKLKELIKEFEEIGIHGLNMFWNCSQRHSDRNCN